MTDKKIDPASANLPKDPPEAPAQQPPGTPRGAAPQTPKEDNRPVRRVGSITLGLCLMAVGVCFLLYYFVPGFNWLLVSKVGAPLALVALGVEVNLVRGPSRPVEIRFPGCDQQPGADERRLLPDSAAPVLAGGVPRTGASRPRASKTNTSRRCTDRCRIRRSGCFRCTPIWIRDMACSRRPLPS